MIRFPVITLLLAAALAPGQTVLVRQDFDSDWSTINPPPGWTIFFDSDTSFNDWHRAPDTSGRNRWPDNPTPYALLDSAPHEEYGYDSLISPYFDCRGLNIVILRCSTFFQGSGVSFYTAQLRGAVDNGQFEHTVYDYYGRQVGPEVQEFPLTWAAGHDSCRLAWMFEGPTSAITGWALDNVHVTGLSSDIDVGVTEVLAPVGQVESAAVFQPVAIIANHGDPSASFPVYFNIGSAYRDSVLVESMPGHSVDTVEFAAWAARQRGDQRIVAHTLALGDIHPENDTVRDTVFVHVANVRPEIIYAPADTVDSNTVVQPRARVTNIGMDTADLYTYLYIGSDYVDSVLVDAFAPGDARDLNFGRNWTATTPGPQPVRCVTAWPPDNYRSDDTLAGSVFVRGAGFRDVAAVKVITPAGTVRESSFVFPRASVKNNGLQPVQLWASLRIALQETIQVYVDSVSLTLGPSQQDTVAFAGWTAWPPDTFRAVLRVNMPGDMDPSNDSARGAGRVLAAFHDVGVRRIVTPADTVIAGPVAPAAWVVNNGSYVEAFRTEFRINSGPNPVYYGSVDVAALGVGESTRVRFPVWNAAVGAYTCRCSTLLAGDANPGNDLRTGTCWVESLNVDTGWVEMSKVPSPGGKPVFHGGALVATMGSGEIHALKGNKTRDFLAYSIAGDSWRVLEPMPAGPREKPVYRSGCLTGDGGAFVYAVKGNNTSEFYGYDLGTGAWQELPPVPEGATGKNPKGGSKLTYVVKGDTGWAYFLKGYKNEFYRFNTVANRWDSTLPPAPTGPSGRDKYKEGSFICFDGDYTIHCVKASENEHFGYDVQGDTWFSSPLAPFPKVGRSGRSKKVKDGAGGAFFASEMYCLKGGGTQEFWKYTPATDTWTELDTIPQVGSTGKKKKVKGGGAITAAMPSVFFAFKGGKTDEFWRYRIPPAGPGIEERPALGGQRLTVGGTTIVHGVLFLSPSLFTPYSSLFDLTGREALPLSPGENDVSGLAPGVYFIRQRSPVSNQRLAVSKVIVE